MSVEQCLASHPCGIGWSAACRAKHDTWHASPCSGLICADETGLRRGISRVPATYSTALRLSRAQCAVRGYKCGFVSYGRGRCAPGSAAGGAARWTAVGCERSDGHGSAVSFVIRQGCGGPADQDPRVRMGLRWTGPILCRAGEGLGDWERPFRPVCVSFDRCRAAEARRTPSSARQLRGTMGTAASCSAGAGHRPRQGSKRQCRSRLPARCRRAKPPCCIETTAGALVGPP